MAKQYVRIAMLNISMNKILIIGPAWIGDMVMAQSLFKLLKERQPGVSLQVAAPVWTLPLLSRMKEISSVIHLPFAHGELNLKLRYKIAKQLRDQAFTQAIVLPNSFKSALIPWWAHIPVRTGWSRELRGLLLNDMRVLDKKRYPRMVERFLALGLSKKEALPPQYPYPELTISPHAKKPKNPVLALCPGAEFGSSKQWPAEYYAEIAQAKLADGWQVWLMGSAKDQTITARIMALTQDQCIDWAGKTKLDEAIDLLSVVNAVVTNDSGLMHIAAALKKPIVALYGSTSPDFTPPLSLSATMMKLNLTCQPCFKRECPLQHHRCMRDLTPSSVLKALNESINY